MALGFDTDRNLYNLTDSAEVYAYVYDEADAPIPIANIASVSFVIQAPDGTKVTQGGTLTAPGEGFLRYLATTQVGQYIAVATFTMKSGQIKSSRADFEVMDRFNPPSPSAIQVIASLVWKKLEDVFDAEDEGPWLRDMTLNYFNRDKMGDYLSGALFDINQWNPPTSFDEKYFVLNGKATPDTPLVVQATFLEVILHLMTSYTEQPLPQGAQVLYEDRRDYVQRWQTIYEIELEKYKRWVVLWKRQFLGLGHTKGLVSSKAGRLVSAPMRTWQVGRGYR